MKKIEVLSDKEVIVDGIRFIRKEETLQGERKFEVGKYYITEYGVMLRITQIDDNWVYYDKTLAPNKGQPLFRVGSGWYNSSRLATPAEIEAHLRKICDEKYVGKKVKEAPDWIVTPTKFYKYDFVRDEIDYSVKEGSNLACIPYKQGKWAEIIPDLKPLPKTRGEFKKMVVNAMTAPDGSSADDFLDQYNFSE